MLKNFLVLKEIFHSNFHNYIRRYIYLNKSVPFLKRLSSFKKFLKFKKKETNLNVILKRVDDSLAKNVDCLT